MQSFLDFYTELVNSPLFVGLGGFALALLAVLAVLSQVKPGPVRDPVGMLRTAMKSERVPYFWFAFFAALWLVVFLVLLVGLVAEIGFLFLTETPGDPATEAGKTAFTELRFHLTKITALTAVLGAVVAFPFTLIRIQLSERQTVATEDGLITDRINKAVENLGATRSISRHRQRTNGSLVYETGANGDPDYDRPIYEEISEPNLEVRIGAIYALERIARQNLNYHIQIMEILTAYLRENAPARHSDTSPRARWHAYWDQPYADEAEWEDIAALAERETGLTEDNTDWEATQRWLGALEAPRNDIQSAVTVIGRRSPAQVAIETAPSFATPNGFRIDLRRTNLQKADLRNLNFSRGLFQGALMQRANLKYASFKAADFSEAHLDGAGIINADLSESYFEEAILDCAHFSRAELVATTFTRTSIEDAVFGNANLRDAYISHCSLNRTRFLRTNLAGVILHGSPILGAGFSGCHLGEANLRCLETNQWTTFRGAILEYARLQDLTLDANTISQQQLNHTFGDATVTLTGGLSQPPHWSDDELERGAFDAEYQNFKSDPDAYIPPQDREDAPSED
ncbi:pentapeptide repeat-containing protein [Aliiroseovarius sp.]|uniref:pentapeptide repeat-containing protein n=1 Tax=Aliiroseovarius sp. TaxID=1872442 RepID=UPI003BA8479D